MKRTHSSDGYRGGVIGERARAVELFGDFSKSSTSLFCCSK